MHLFTSLKLTSKIVLLVMLLGALAVSIMVYSMTSLSMVSRDYQNLLEKDAQASLLIGAALLDLSDSSELVLSVLTEQQVAEMRATQEQLKNQRAQFNDKIGRIAPLIDQVNAQIDEIGEQEKQLFALADAIIDAAARWRGDKALKIIDEEFEPQLIAMRQDMDHLKADTIAHFQAASQRLKVKTQATIANTTLLFTLALVGIIGLSASLSFTQISRPIKQLTRAMGRLSLRDYQTPIHHTERGDEVGQMAQALEVFRDNMLWADRLEVEAAASARARELAEQVAEAKANFLATMSHEIRTPMNAILGLAQLSLRHPLETGQRERVEKIMRASQHLTCIINDILDYSALDGGHVSVEEIPFSPQQLLDDARDMLAETAANKGLSLHAEPSNCPSCLVGDPHRINQILLNYANNAIKFSDHGRISLCMEFQQQADDLLYLYGEVQDQGIGLDEQQIETLFQPFHQVDNSISRRFGGTGLGLAISSHLAELMGGATGVRSELGKGSTFWFRVQVRQPESHETLPETMPSEQKSNAQSLRGLRLLLADDNELNRLVAKELLMDEGIVVDEAGDGQQAVDLIEAAADNTYAIVLMDMMMPKLDGLSATRRLRRSPRFDKLPIIAMTANASKEDVMKCMEAGMNAHVAKPIELEILLKTLAEHRLCSEATTLEEAQTQADNTAMIGSALPASNTLDPKSLEHLRTIVTPERFNSLVDMLIADIQQRGELFQSLAPQGEPKQFRQHAHDLIGSAGHVGLNQLRDLGKAMTQATKDDDVQTARRLAAEIHRATGEAIQELQKRFKSQ
ncbi:response regulator [Thiorhodovibrio frisius]|uniref:histidine kinase n=1 Tax=Thiorhodovibrio frisius TaxID=631362 RepID=H8Z6S8_9GAMM|nr:response regulator [Thiorhodovibrio frisius]EIC20794.1 signal transduction histidine kinase [Thiorhodovibrio frisius]WPL21845.1 Sensor protein TorS [Thiorhodovibrio frisius]